MRPLTAPAAALRPAAEPDPSNRERQAAARGWYYLREPEDGRLAPAAARLAAGDGATLTRRLQGCLARVVVEDRSGASLPSAALIRGAQALGLALEASGAGGGAGERGAVRLRLGPAGTPLDWAVVHDEDIVEQTILVDGLWVAGCGSPHPVEAALAALLDGPNAPPAPARSSAPPAPAGPRGGRPRVLFFESLMNSDMPHNDRELSQGVLHMISALDGMDVDVALANVKMPIVGVERPVEGLDRLAAVVAEAPIHLVVITLLEGYFEGVERLVATLRGLGCRARVAVGGVMPTLSPLQVAAQLGDVSFVCRGAGEPTLPALVAAVGASTVDEPFTAAQQAALLQLSGLICLEPGLLLSAMSGRVPKVPTLDATPLALRYLQARHIEGGVEISTSRGCVHRCTFCSIIGREDYQARSATGVFDLLEAYAERFRALYGERVPPNAFRVHISDDDFACDKARAAAILVGLLQTRFRLSSAQVSVADLCLREGGRLLPVPDPVLFGALRPECFADFGAPVPERDYVADHRSRRWSSYLQIGVETFAEAELLRLGKGYRRVHVRAVAAALDAAGLHFDAYYIQSNAETTAADLVEGALELCRLKLRSPRYFHLRFPVVPHLVSYFSSASYRQKARAGKLHQVIVRRTLQVPGFPELDYPLVDHDAPQDPLVAAAVARGFLTDERLYCGSLGRLSEALALAAPEGHPEADRALALRRLLDDGPRRLAFELLARARRAAKGGQDPEWPGPAPTEAQALAVATGLLGPPAQWIRTFRRFDSEEVPRLVVVPTWQCELRCRYCLIPKQDGRVMPWQTLRRAIDLLLSSDRPELILQFFGGEALLEWGLVVQALDYGQAAAAARGKALRFVLSSNGWSLDEEKLAILARYPVKLELSLDGDPDTQNRFRRAFRKGEDSYTLGIAPRVGPILASGLPYDVIMVVHPKNVDKMADNFFHIAGLGFARVQINFTLGARWSAEEQRAFAAGLAAVAAGIAERRAAGQDITMINLENRPMPVRLNGEITVDHDGQIYGGNAFLHETEHKHKLRVGHLDEASSFDRLWMDAPDNEALLAWSYPPDITENNLQVGKIMHRFLVWMAQGEAERRASVGPPAAPGVGPGQG
jgi:MoaA/NifB/PqqE/SkfB family radical SAM enzyme